MKSNRINEMAERIVPKELIGILKSLNSEFDWAIMSALEQKELTFSGLKEFIGTEDNKLLTYHLKKLAIKGLILHYYKHSDFEQDYSYYSISKLAKKLIRNINDVFDFGKLYPEKFSFINSISLSDLNHSSFTASSASNIPQIKIVNANETKLKVEQ